MRDDLKEIPLQEGDAARETQEVHDWLDHAIRATVDAQHAPPRPAAAPAEPPLDRFAATAPLRPASPRWIGKKQSSAPLRRQLEPVPVPKPRESSGRRSWLFLRYVWIVIPAAIVAYGIAVFAPQSRVAMMADASRSDATPPAPVQDAAHLVVHDQQVFANDPLPLDVSIDKSLANASVRVAGLAAGTHLSVGSPSGESGWTVPLDGLKNLFMYAPTDFVGVMHSNVDLRGPDKKLIDRREVKLEWVERKKDSARAGEPSAAANPTSAMTVAAKEMPPRNSPIAALDTGAGPAAPPVAPAVVAKETARDAGMSKETADSLMQRGQDALKSGDIATARMLFTRLAEGGIADAAFSAAQTYDPHYLATHNVLGVSGDETKARDFYQRAAALGSTEASAQLAGVVAK